MKEKIIKGLPPKSISKIIGNKFNRFYVLDYYGYKLLPSKQKYHLLKCICECGKEIIANSNHVMYGKWKSCGCLKIDHPNRFIHGYAKTIGKRDKIYETWRAMHVRTSKRLENDSIRKYGEKGIKICAGWNGKFGFINFKNDMLPITGKSIDRIDNDLHYSCGHCDECIKMGWKLNCRWADDFTQSNNRGNFNNWITVDGKKMTYRQADKYLGFKPKTLQNRIKILGWSEKKAITTPVLKHLNLL